MNCTPIFLPVSPNNDTEEHTTKVVKNYGTDTKCNSTDLLKVNSSIYVDGSGDLSRSILYTIGFP